MAYSHHFIKKVLKLKPEGVSFLKLSNRFNISVRSIQEWLKGNLPKGTRNKPNTKLDLVKLKQDVLDYPDAYLKERAERLGVSEHCISYNLKKLDVTYKKNSDSPQSRRRQAKIISEKD
ncbi:MULTISPECIES: IS630 transposase-related protein [Francisella]|uniref:Transposase n=1 Tax=Francisella opportunistica TaxID=2016517 RepID=A0A345JPF7_9GAMM|nr:MULTISPECIES: IS630 transposase-related protein [Francisella]APC90873.1 putative transposase [Francisella sp. MA067296]AXH29203.1 transposase [Francisella opportunistica]AXH30854.1 transposase [Francisella opportunistica]AXH32499.1 transposase [Francisella opportunistica]